MSVVERLYDLGQSAIVAIFAGISGAVFWVVRNVLTNKQELELTRQKLDRVTDGLTRIETLLIENALKGREK